jgi:hypothetical protein
MKEKENENIHMRNVFRDNSEVQDMPLLDVLLLQGDA